VTGLFKSTDGGANWRLVKSTATSNGVLVPRFVFDPPSPAKIYALVCAPNGNIMRVLVSTDDGDRWDVLDLQIPGNIRSLAIDTDNPSVLYATTSRRGVLKTSDNAAS